MSVTPWSADFTSGDASEFIATGGGGATDSNGWGVISYVTASPAPYKGTYCGKSLVKAGGTTGFARWNKSDTNIVEGDDVYIGYAIYIASGFYPTAQTSSTRLTTIDNFNVTTSEDRLGLWIYSDDSVRVLKHKEGTGESTLINLGAGTSVLPEGQWNYVEQRFKLSRTDGQAVSQIWINGVLKGSSTAANLQSNAEFPFGRFRLGLCDISWVRAADVVMYFDDCYMDTKLRQSWSPTEPTLSDLAAKVGALDARMKAVEASAARSDRKLEAIETVDLGYRPSFAKQGNALKAL